MRYIEATSNEKEIVAKLQLKLWPNHTFDEMLQEADTYINDENSIIYLAAEENKYIGFVQGTLRNDYVEGTETSPVGYLEGIFVCRKYRSKGIGKRLLEICEQWAKNKGCIEFASDCELDNEASLKFHLKLGFKEANRVICFTKKIK